MIRILLPVAGIGVDIWILVAIGGVIGLLSGLLGVGGGFLLTPALMMIGVSPTVAAASGTNAIVAASSSGVAAHFRLRNVDLRLGAILVAGSLIGAEGGVRCVRILRQLGNADFAITITYILMLGFVGTFIVRDSWHKMRGGLVAGAVEPRPPSRGLLSHLPFQMEFPRSGVRHSFLLPFTLCLFVGLLTGIMGVAGSFIVVPLMVYVLRVPMHVAVGTSLFQALFTCAGATVMQAGTNHDVDLVLALLIAGGSTFGAQIGARLSRMFRGEQLMILLGLLALGVMVRMLFTILLPPSIRISEIALFEWARSMQHFGSGACAHLWQIVTR